MTTTSVQQQSTISFLSKRSVQSRFEELLGKRAPAFISSLLQVVQTNALLQKADPQSILNAAATAATLDLPINQNLGFAWIVPYKGKGQFQMGWRGFVQLALRTGQYKKINVIEVYENQFNSFNALTEDLDCDFSQEGSGAVVGYVAYFKLINGFEKTVYWSRSQMVKHAKKYSQSYKKNQGVWADGEDGFTAMAKKTVLKNTLSKYGIMSVELQRAHLVDQAVVDEHFNPEYPDNQGETPEEIAKREEENRTIDWITKSESIDELEMLKAKVGEFEEGSEAKKFYELKEKELTKKKK